MTPAQRGVIDKYLADLRGATDSYQLYCMEDKAHGALSFLLDTQTITREEYDKLYGELMNKVGEAEAALCI